MSIHKRTNKRGTSWMVSWREGAKQQTRTFPTRAAAKAWQAEVDRAKARGLNAPAVASKMALAEWLDRWFTERNAEWARTTIIQRASCCERHIIPTLGHVPLANLNRAAVRDWRQAMLDKGATPNTCNAAMRVLSAALGAAVENDLIAANPCVGIKAMSVQRQRPQAHTPQVIESIRREMPTDRDRLVVSLMAYCGLRPAEVCGLRWDDIGQGVLFVERSVQFGEVVSTKTGTGRSVEVAEPVMVELEALRGEPGAFVTPGVQGGPLNWKMWNRKVWVPTVRAIGVKAVPYDCRHTAASLWIHEGRSLAWVAKQLGHANQSTTLEHYSHAYEQARLITAVPMVEAIRGARNG